MCCGGGNSTRTLDGRITWDCTGTCVQKSAKQCPTLWDWDGFVAVVDAGKNFAVRVGRCVKEQVQDGFDYIKALTSVVRDLINCTEVGDTENMIIKITCAAVSPELVRLASALDETGAMARRYGYDSAAHARDVGFAALSLGMPRRVPPHVAALYERFSSTAGQLPVLQPELPHFEYEFGDVSKPHESCLKKAGCSLGASLNVFAEVDFAPQLVGTFNMMTPSLDLQFEGDFVGSAGIRVLAAGGCAQKFRHSFPEAPYPVGNWCFGSLCVAMTMQGLMEAIVDGSLEADARAEMFANYRITGSVSLDLQEWAKTGTPRCS
jgi:hypothetical protein